jgi:hypothetical protein
MASLIAKSVTMTIKGTEPSPGFEAPKMEKIYIKSYQRVSDLNRRELAYTKDNDEKEIDVGNVVKLKPQVLWEETQRCVFGGPYLVPSVILLDVSLFVFRFVWKRDVHIDRPRFRLDRRAGILGGRLLGIGAKFSFM